MKIALGADHAGFEARQRLLKVLERAGHKVKDFGTFSCQSVDYPDIARKVAEDVSSGKSQRGILICGTGIGMSIVANKFPRVRAAVCHNRYTARISRAHNNSNILCLGGRVLSIEQIVRLTSLWLKTAFQKGRHARRVGKISRMEKSLFSSSQG